MTLQDTPGRPKSSSSRQQTHANQGIQSGSNELDKKAADSKDIEAKRPGHQADPGGEASSVKPPNPRIAK